MNEAAQSLEELRALAKKVAKEAATVTAPVCLADEAQPITQPFLFDEVDLGSELLTIEDDRKSNRHTGTTLEKRQALYDDICDRLAAGVAIRTVCRIYRVGRNTVRAIVRRLEASGKMDPLKKRLAGKYGEVIELGTDYFLEKLMAGEVPVTAIPIAVGIFADKKALLEGEPTAILGKTEKDLSIEAVNGFWERMKRLKGAPIDVPTTTAPEAQSGDSQSSGQAVKS